MSESKTPLLDQLEEGPWPSFVTEIKRAAKEKDSAKDLLHQLLSTGGGFENLFQVLPGLAVLRDVIHGEFRIADNRKQNVVKIMGNTACQGSNGLQFHYLLQLPFRIRQGFGSFFNLFFENGVLISKQLIEFQTFQCIGCILKNNR